MLVAAYPLLGLLPHFLDWGSQPTAGLLRQRVPTRGCCCHSLSHSVLPFAFGRPGSVVHPHFCLLLYGIWWESTTFQQHFGCERKRTDLSLLLSLLSVSPHAPHGPRGREAVLGSRLVVKSLILSEDVPHDMARSRPLQMPDTWKLQKMQNRQIGPGHPATYS